MSEEIDKYVCEKCGEAVPGDQIFKCCLCGAECCQACDGVKDEHEPACKDCMTHERRGETNPVP